MLVLSADMLLWLNAVTEDTIHQEIELDREDNLDLGGAVTAASEAPGRHQTASSPLLCHSTSIPRAHNTPSTICQQRWPTAASASAVPASSA